MSPADRPQKPVPHSKEFKSLVGALDERLTRRPRRHPYSVVIFTEETHQGLAKRIVTTYGARLNGTHVTHAQVPPSLAAGTQDIETLLDRLADDLIPEAKGMGWLRRGFPRFNTCRNALSISSATPHPDERRLRDDLYGKLTERHGLLRLPEKVLNHFPNWFKGTIEVIAGRSLLCWLYGCWLRRTPKLSWVPKVTGSDSNFLHYIRTRGPEWRERILVEALLRDLEWQLRSSPFSVGRRRRLPFVILMPEAHENGPARQFVEECAKALDSSDRGQRPMRWTPVRVLAACGHQPLEARVRIQRINAGDQALVDAADALTSEAAPPDTNGSPVLLQVPAPSLDPDERQNWPDNPPVHKHWYDYLFPITTLLIPVGLAAIIIFGIILPCLSGHTHGPCADTWVTGDTGERVGLTDGSCTLSSGPHSSDPELVGLEHAIAAQNGQVQALNRQDPAHHPYQTVVVLSPLTVPTGDPGHVGHDSVDELRGVVLAQADALQKAQHDPTVVPIKVLLANAGDRFSAGLQVADHIVNRANSDKTLAAVMGISQSRTESHQAIQRLSGLQIPIIGSTTTSDEILDSSTLYYEIAPRDAREAQTIALFLNRQPIMAGPEGQMVLAKNAVVIEDPSDEYSQNLAEDFRRSFTALGNKIVQTFDYGPGPGTPPRDPKNIGDTPEGSADQLVNDLCNTIGNGSDVVFYASRAQQLPAMLDKVNQEAACAGRQLGIMGSDEEARNFADGTISPSNYTAVHFYDAAFSDLTQKSTPAAQQFAERYNRRYGRPAVDSGAADAYDAFNAASMAINLSYQQDPSMPRGVVATKMSDGLVRLTGVTGLISFNGAHDITRVPLDKPIFVVLEQPHDSITLLACGRYADGRNSEWSTWGTGGQKFPCPHDPPQ